jgi:hypothetical protein
VKFFRHIRDWLEAYFWLPLSLGAVVGAAALYQFLVGRPVMENPVWLVGYAEKLVQLFLLLVFTTINKQQTGGAWLDKLQKLDLMQRHPAYAVAEALKTPFYFVAAIYVLLH